ncbi:MAG: response regulator [Anaerolineae bacterium]
MTSSISVLYIDDDASNLDTVLRVLTRHGYTVIIARTGTEGLAKALEEHPDVILLDIVLPDIDGFEVCQQIRTTPEIADTPIIGLSGNTMHGDRQRGLSAGFDAYLAKPIMRLELLNAIERLNLDD